MKKYKSDYNLTNQTAGLMNQSRSPIMAYRSFHHDSHSVKKVIFGKKWFSTKSLTFFIQSNNSMQLRIGSLVYTHLFHINYQFL